MRRTVLLLSTALATAMLAIVPAHAQEAGNPDANRAAIARMEVRFGALEERLRQMQGKIEEVQYENRRLREQVDLFQQDANIRFTELEDKTRGVEAPAAAPAAEEETPAPAAAPTSTEKQVLKMPNPNSTQFEDSREHYNYAFGLLNKTQYDAAGKSFEEFIKAHPKDPLIGNAYYWAGETYYVRQNYVQAADYFRQGFEAMPEGPKAGDNLLKLAMTLSALDRSSEACIVLKQVAVKYGKNSTTLKQKAETERSRLGCK